MKNSFGKAEAYGENKMENEKGLGKTEAFLYCVSGMTLT